MVDPTDYWPNVLYDTREGIYRANIYRHFHSEYLGGVIRSELLQNEPGAWSVWPVRAC